MDAKTDETLRHVQQLVADDKRRRAILKDALENVRFYKASDRPKDIIPATKEILAAMNVRYLLPAQLVLPEPCATTCLDAVQYLLQLLIGSSKLIIDTVSKDVAECLEELLPRVPLYVLAERQRALLSLLQAWKVAVAKVLGAMPVVASLTASRSAASRTMHDVLQRWCGTASKHAPGIPFKSLDGPIQEFIHLVNHCVSVCATLSSVSE
jgi:hypothetical protein